MNKILIVDDDTELAKMCNSAFLFSGYKTELAFDGKEGFEKSLDFKPDIVLSDIMMPKIDGLKLLEKMKKDKRTKDVKVVLMTKLKDEENIKNAKMLGAEMVIIKKDHSVTEIVSLITDILQRG